MVARVEVVIVPFSRRSRLFCGLPCLLALLVLTHERLRLCWQFPARKLLLLIQHESCSSRGRGSAVGSLPLESSALFLQPGLALLSALD